MRRERRDIRSWKRVRRAFTLLKVVVALAVTGLILLGGRLLLKGVGRIALSTTRAAEASDRAQMVMRCYGLSLVASRSAPAARTSLAAMSGVCTSPRGATHPRGGSSAATLR